MSTAPVARPVDHPVTVPATSVANAWLAAGLLLSLILFYLVGVDQGATSVFGNDTHIHEFVHDARHLLGFPCH